jgi:prepilin-type N-terminal cleavage/methylation domain-containing protein
MRKAFTLMEMVVALGILAVVVSFAGVIFRVSAESHRLAVANAEIMQKLRAITEQLDADFRGLRKDGEILAFWHAERKQLKDYPDLANYTRQNNNAEEAFERFDRIMFFADGDFQTYGTYTDPQDAAAKVQKPICGSIARICYTLANIPTDKPAEPNRPQGQRPQTRILARTEHILVPPKTAPNPADPLGMGKWTDSQWRDWMSKGEYDVLTLRGWELIPSTQKADILSAVGDVLVGIKDGDVDYKSTKNETAGGVTLDLAQPQSLHVLLCRGVGQFEIQGWNDAERRWMPQVNPNGNADLKDDSDFVLAGDNASQQTASGQWNPHQGTDLDPRNIPGLWYPRGPARIGNTMISPLDRDFNKVPGLGRALKFTFTLYDSRGLIKNGRTFTHIVYLDN